MVSLQQPNFGKSFSRFRTLRRKFRKVFRGYSSSFVDSQKKISSISIGPFFYGLGNYISRHISTKIVRVGTYYLIFLVLVTGIIQPQLLQFHIGNNDNQIVASIVFAQQIADEQQDGSLQFENFLTETGEDNRLIYTVKAGENIGSIAKQFATSTKELLKANELADGNILRPGQKIVISYARDQLIYEVEESMSLTDFADSYELTLDDLMNLNFIASADHLLMVGDQLLLDLSIPEAQRKNLYQKPEYETPEELLALDVPETEEEILPAEITLAYEEPIVLIDDGEIAQKIISAEETTNAFDTEEERKIQEIKNREVAAAQIKINEEQRLLDEKKAKESPITQIIPSSTKPIIPVQQKVIEAQATSTQCGSNKCFYNGKCWNLPANATCAAATGGEARSCLSGYKEYASQCVSNAVYEQKKAVEKAKAVTKPAKHGIISKWYFNPYNDGYANGRAGGHCTHGAGRRRRKNYGIMTNRRGNGGQWYYNASAAGRQVGQTPEVGAIFSTKGAAANGRYGHVGIVTQIDRSSGSMMVVDMNYVNQYTFSQRRVPIKMSGLIGFIYPRKK